MLRYDADVLRRTQGDGQFGNHQEEQFVVVNKQVGSGHICIDYRLLNKLILFDTHSMIPPADLFQGLEHNRYFSKIDLSKDYWQISFRQQDISKTAFVTINRHYECRLGC
ncbi:RNA-directed DNA polymerase homolog [Plakobranchus ocellatus]|uniref:RNA-directed DNA polymerase homolog n=1 Tax=Plakobranchus ocellatus TaxID=259542 RepID=A0AAV4CBT2_9GAST|nr:RNA-directed DNA polymerase homolog [Plakobranchus ocellatus]